MAPFRITRNQNNIPLNYISKDIRVGRHINMRLREMINEITIWVKILLNMGGEGKK